MKSLFTVVGVAVLFSALGAVDASCNTGVVKLLELLGCDGSDDSKFYCDKFLTLSKCEVCEDDPVVAGGSVDFDCSFEGCEVDVTCDADKVMIGEDDGHCDDGMWKDLPQCTVLTDCSEVPLAKGDGVYPIHIPGRPSADNLYCIAEGGWTVIQRNNKGSLDFNRTMAEYVNGFGSQADEMWAGLEIMHELTNTGTWALQVHMTDDDDTKYIATWNTFSVGSSDDYVVTIESFDANSDIASDLFSLAHDGKEFATFDDDTATGDCAASEGSGMWYGGCSTVNPNVEPIKFFPLTTAVVLCDIEMWIKQTQ